MPAESFTLAAAQAEPVYHDKEGTLDKICRWIKRAGNEGADLGHHAEFYTVKFGKTDHMFAAGISKFDCFAFMVDNSFIYSQK